MPPDVAAPAVPAAAPAAPAAPAAAPAAADTASSIVSAATPTAGEKPAEGAKPAEGEKPGDKPAEAAKPGDIEIKVPEGLKVEEATLTELKGILADEKMTPGQRGEALLAMYAKNVEAAAKAPYDLWNDTQTKWQNEAKADAEIGGANFEPMKAAVAKAIDAIGGTEAAKIRAAFDFTGAGNNPEIIRFMYRAAKALTEGGPISGKPAAGDGAQKTLAAMYPSSSNGQQAAAS